MQHRTIRRAGAAGVIGTAVALVFSVVAFAHAPHTITGTVDCKGNYTIDGTADWWGGVSLVVTLDGSTVATYTTTEADQDTSVRAFPEVTGTGASAGEAIGLYTSDNTGNVLPGTLVLTVQSCSTPPASPPVSTPKPTPRPAPPVPLTGAA
jgi:hypothetical protein